MFDLWYNGDTSNITAPWRAGNTPKSLPAVGAKRCATMSNSIVSHSRGQKAPADYHALASCKGMKWLGPYTGKTIDRTMWECPKGHRFSMSYSSLRKPNHGCLECGRHQPEDYHARAAAFGHIWLGPEVPTSMTKTRWRCANGHEWETAFQALRGCPHCWHEHSGDAFRHTADDYRLLATRNGCEWLGPEVTSVREQTRWRCPLGHEWFASYSYILGGYGCKVCACAARAEQRRIKPEQYHEMAVKCGLVWLGPEVRAIKEKTWWQCAAGHKWHATYNVLQQGQNCPECQDLVNGRRASKPQRALCDMVGGVLNYKIGRCTVDIAVFRADAKIGIEYDCYYWHAKTQANDYRRAQYMVRRGWKILGVKANVLLPSQEQIDAALSVLLDGKDYHELVLEDWGGGKVRQ